MGASSCGVFRYFARDLRTHFVSAYPWLSALTPVRAYWCRANNFGDWITPVLLRHYGFNPVYSTPAGAAIVSVGSILEVLPDAVWRGGYRDGRDVRRH